MKNFRKLLIIFVLIIVLIYVTNITGVPDSITLFKGEELNLYTIFGIEIIKEENKTIQTSSLINSDNIVEKTTAHLKLFNYINLKDIEINIIPDTKVIPLGNAVGLKLYTSGVLVVGMTEIDGQKPYKDSGIEEGDMIIKINDEEITCTEELVECINNSNGEDLNIIYLRDGKEYATNIEPIKTDENKYKLGLWVRDGAAGIGTLTYYEPSTKKFAALGHGIMDVDTEKLVSISSGELVSARISSIVKGQKDTPRRNKRKYC